MREILFITFVDNSLLLPTVIFFINLLAFEDFAKSLTPRFF